jgi:hypothetical protein
MAKMQSVEAILAEVERLPAVKLEIDDAESWAGVRVGARVVARIDLRHGGVLVNAPGDMIPTLQRVFPSSRPTPDGIVFDLADPEGCSEALAAIRRRVNVESLIWQVGDALP